MTCAEVADLAGLYVLDALEPAERERVAAHLASCPEAHAEYAAAGGVAPALASLSEPIDAPPSLKTRVLADYRATTVVRPAAAPVVELRRYRQPWLGWAAAAAVLILAVTAGWAYVAQSRADQEAQRSNQIAAAIDVMLQPNSTVALLSGSGSALGAHGFAAFSANGNGYLVMVGLPDAPAGRTYQAWYLSGGQATSAGLLSVDAKGNAVLKGSVAGLAADSVALTIEPAGGVAQPTSAPIALGELQASTAPSFVAPS